MKRRFTSVRVGGISTRQLAGWMGQRRFVSKWEIEKRDGVLRPGKCQWGLSSKETLVVVIEVWKVEFDWGRKGGVVGIPLFFFPFASGWMGNEQDRVSQGEA